MRASKSFVWFAVVGLDDDDPLNRCHKNDALSFVVVEIEGLGHAGRRLDCVCKRVR